MVSTLLREIEEHKSRLAALSYRLQRGRLALAETVAAKNRLHRRWHLSEFGVSIGPVPLWRFARVDGVLRMVRQPAIGGGARDLLSISKRAVDGGICVSLVGEIDLSNAVNLLTVLQAAGGRDQHVIVDIAGLRYIDSSGVRVIVDAFHAFQVSKLRMSLAAPTGQVKRILEIVGVYDLVPVFETVEEALHNLNDQR